MNGRESDHVIVRSKTEIDSMRLACAMAAETLLGVGDMIDVGVSGLDIDQFVQRDTKKKGGIPATLGYRGYPKSVCVSVNEVVCHGIPSSKKLESGDIVNVDVTTIYNGWHGDTSATFYVGDRKPEAVAVTEAARNALAAGIAKVRPGARLGDIGAAIQELAESLNMSTVRDFYGHGIGRNFHELPNVPHFGTRGKGFRLKAGMTFTIEPMICFGKHDVRLLDDKWAAVTVDGSLSAQFEHTICVTDTGCEILTARNRNLANSELF